MEEEKILSRNRRWAVGDQKAGSEKVSFFSKANFDGVNRRLRAFVPTASDQLHLSESLGIIGIKVKIDFNGIQFVAFHSANHVILRIQIWLVGVTSPNEG